MPFGIGQSELQGLLTGAVADRDEAGDAATLDELAADQMSRALGGDEQRIDSLRRFDLAKVDVEAVRAHQDVARLQMLGDVLPIHVGLDLVGQQNVDQVGLAGSPRRPRGA